METPTGIQWYDKALRKFATAQSAGDSETAHCVQDQIYRRFVRDVAKGLASQEVARVIEKLVVRHDRGRWYA